MFYVCNYSLLTKGYSSTPSPSAIKPSKDVLPSPIRVSSCDSARAPADEAAALGSVINAVSRAGASPNMAPPERVLLVDLYGTSAPAVQTTFAFRHPASLGVTDNFRLGVDSHGPIPHEEICAKRSPDPEFMIFFAVARALCPLICICWASRIPVELCLTHLADAKTRSLLLTMDIW